MKPQEWKDSCTACGDVLFAKDVTGTTPCEATGGKHVVKMRTFYHLGGKGVVDARQRRLWSPLLICKPGRSYQDKDTGEPIVTPGLHVQFEQSGLYHTDDPEKQFYLMTKYDLPNGEEGQKLWNAVYLTDAQQKVIAQDELASLQKQIDDRNAHLATLQQQTIDNENAAAERRASV